MSRTSKYNSDYWHTIENVEAVDETQLGLKVLIEGKIYWLPKSQIHEDSECYKANATGTLIIPNWLAREKDLI
jgi:hypothetical protein